MDDERFDELTRALAARFPRRLLAGLVTAAVTALGDDGAEGKKRRNGRKDEKDRRRRDGRPNRRDAGVRSDAEGRNNARDLEAEGKKKGKKGKGKKGKPKRGTTGGGCPAGLQSCNGGCVPKDEPCCAPGKRPCDRACVADDACCEAGFAQCMAPIVPDWQQAVDGCAESCADPESAACDECARGVIEAFTAPLVRCVQINCPGEGGNEAASAERRADVAASALRACKWNNWVTCQHNALAQNFLQGGLGSTWALVTGGPVIGPVEALGPAVLSAGQFQADLKACDQQFGCPGGWCDPTHEICCSGRNCEKYDPGTKTCRGCTEPGSYCESVTQTCKQNCKECNAYVKHVPNKGPQYPCGSKVNNCGKTITCQCPGGGAGCRQGVCCWPRGCGGGYRQDTRCGNVDDGCGGTVNCGACDGSSVCVDGICERFCPRNRAGAQGADDPCCQPLTCAEMGKSCGRWSDGCGDMLDCGTCATAAQPGAYCDFVTGTCVCYPDNACLAGTCGAMSDGCGGTKQCGSCATAAKPRAVCGADNQCRCTPATCGELDKTCGIWSDGCGGTVDCGSSGRKTCAQLGKSCGVWDDGCNGSIDCGGCATENRPRAFCDETGSCVCNWDGYCHGGCGPEPDGCGGVVDCGRCDSESSPKAYCGEDRQCHCEPDSCAALGETCGYHRDGCGGSADCGNHHLLCGRGQDICCAEGQTCCGLDWEDSACCNWSACHRWPGGKPKGCCPDVQQCLNKSGNEACCPEGWRCRGGGDPSHPTENCCVMSGQGHEALHIDGTLCCSGRLASLFPHICE